MRKTLKLMVKMRKVKRRNIEEAKMVKLRKVTVQRGTKVWAKKTKTAGDGTRELNSTGSGMKRLSCTTPGTMKKSRKRRNTMMTNLNIIIITRR